MQTNDVYYAEQPNRVVVTVNGGNALVEFPVNVTEVETEDGKQYCAEKVYSLRTKATENLAERVEANYDAWLDIAKVVETPKTTVNDLVDAINALTDMVIGGMA